MAGNNVEHLNEDNFRNAISKGIALVDFTATWCGPCRMLTPIIEQLADLYKGKAKIAKLDIDEAQQTTADFQITSVPTLILFENGQEIKRVVGVKDLDFLKNLIDTKVK